jgi:hypothetical protein
LFGSGRCSSEQPGPAVAKFILFDSLGKPRDRKCMECGLEEVAVKEFVSCSLCAAVVHPGCLAPAQRALQQYNEHWGCSQCVSRWESTHGMGRVDWASVAEWSFVAS